jgi:hypothetical protein
LLPQSLEWSRKVSVAAGDTVAVGKADTAPAALVADLATVWVAAEIEPESARSPARRQG